MDALRCRPATISSHGFDNDGSAQVGAQLAGAYVDTALSLATALVGTPLATILPCSTSATADHACAETFLNKYGRRLFRRPITTGGARSLPGVLRRVEGEVGLQDRAEVDDGRADPVAERALPQRDRRRSGGGMRQLSAYEVATELAYTFTGTTPTRRAADHGGQRQPGRPDRARARPCWRPTPGKQTLHRVLRAVPRLRGRHVDAEAQHRELRVGQRRTWSQETRAFITDVVSTRRGRPQGAADRDHDQPVEGAGQLLRDRQHVHGRLPDARPPTTRRCTRPAGTGIGVLAQGSFLSTHAVVGSRRRRPSAACSRSTSCSAGRT